MTIDPSKEIVPTLRAAQANDLPAMLALLADASLPTVGVAESVEQFIVAERDSVIVGAVGLELRGEQFALLRSAVVAPAVRGSGLGQALIERAIVAARSRQLDALYLLTTTAEAYFPKFGFERVARDVVPDAIRSTEEFTSACPASAAVMMRVIRERQP